MHPPQSDFETLVIGCMARLKTMALYLCKNAATADDLVQESVYRALLNQDKFIRGSNIEAWMWTIMRNYYFTQRRRKRLVEDPDDSYALAVPCHPFQQDIVEAKEALKQVNALPASLRVPLLMIADGATYEEAAEECGVHLGTIKSRVCRARAMLQGKEGW